MGSEDRESGGIYRQRVCVSELHPGLGSDGLGVERAGSGCPLIRRSQAWLKASCTMGGHGLLFRYRESGL